jgi:hypothetical protein
MDDKGEGWSHKETRWKREKEVRLTPYPNQLPEY